MNNKKRILLVDDNRSTLDSLQLAIKQHEDFEVIATDSPLHAIILLKKQTIDLVVSDMYMPETYNRSVEIQGFELLSIIKNDFPDTKFLFYTVSDSPNSITNALKMGCNGYVIKGRKGLEMLLKAIDSIFEKGVYVNDYISSILKRKESQKKILESLTEEEMEIIKLLSSGLSDKEIVTEMQISIRLFEKRMLEIFEKFNVRNKFQMVCHAIQNNLLEL